MKNCNEGHRARLRERFLKAGKDGFAEHELLELILCYAIPRKDVKPVAKELLNRFGSLQAVFSASHEQLLLCRGLGESSAVLLTLFRIIGMEIMPGALTTDTILISPEAVRKYLMLNYRYVSGETLFLLLLDSDFRLVDKLEISGSSSSVLLNRSEISLKILSCPKVRQVIMAHNHPGNNPLPSKSDINSTLELKMLLQEYGISLLDHFIVSDRQCVSIMKAPWCKDKK